MAENKNEQDPVPGKDGQNPKKKAVPPRKRNPKSSSKTPNKKDSSETTKIQKVAKAIIFRDMIPFNEVPWATSFGPAFEYNLNSFGEIPKGVISNYKRTADLVNQQSDAWAEISKFSQDQEHEKLKKKYDELKTISDELRTQLKFNHITSRIHPDAAEMMLITPEFLDNFEDGTRCSTTVLSIDIRRSTDLMLKAKSPKAYSNFITELTSRLADCVKQNYGVFDKFTGDGILAFFPKFLSGEDNVIKALKTASLCHDIFKDHYESSKSNFHVFLQNIGLGCGIDYGEAALINNDLGELTVVGIPVVYACRMSSAPAGLTYINQSAKEEAQKYLADYIVFEENSLKIKHEGDVLAYTTSDFFKEITTKEPHWSKEDE